LRTKVPTEELYIRHRRLIDALPQHWSVAEAAKEALLPYRKAMRILTRLGYRYELLDPKGTPVLGIGRRHEVSALKRRPEEIESE